MFVLGWCSRFPAKATQLVCVAGFSRVSLDRNLVVAEFGISD